MGRVGRPSPPKKCSQIFKVDVLLERTIHLESDLVYLKSSDDFLAAVRAVGGVGPPSRPKLTGCDLQCGCFFGKDYPFGVRLCLVKELR